MDKPKVINWFYSGKCNLGCKFCYGKFNEDTLSIKDKKIIIDKIVDAGVEKLTITGGEPLMSEDLLEIIDYAYNKNLFTSLHTNGILLDEDLVKSMAGKVGRISLAIEGVGNDINFSMRGHKDFFNIVINRLEITKKYQIPISVKTVASKKNIGRIVKLIPLLEKYNPDVWLISEFRSARRGKKYEEEFSIEKSEFEKLKKQCESASFKISMRTTEDGLNRPFFFIDSNGDVMSDFKGRYKSVGSIFEESIEELWDKILELVPLNDDYINQPVIN